MDYIQINPEPGIKGKAEHKSNEECEHGSTA